MPKATDDGIKKLSLYPNNPPSPVPIYSRLHLLHQLKFAIEIARIWPAAIFHQTLWQDCECSLHAKILIKVLLDIALWKYRLWSIICQRFIPVA